MSIKLLLLLFLYQVKHFVADYPLQNNYMLGKFKEEGWILPLACHAGVHAIFTLLLALILVAPKLAILLAIFDFVVHFGMDRVKASPKMLGRFQNLSKRDFERSVSHPACTLTDKDFSDNKKFWWSLGLDQMVHHLTHYVIIYFLI